MDAHDQKWLQSPLSPFEIDHLSRRLRELTATYQAQGQHELAHSCRVALNMILNARKLENSLTQSFGIETKGAVHDQQRFIFTQKINKQRGWLDG
jgi:hypothetical protein